MTMMMRWFDRSFGLGLGNELLPMILERFRGTPLRLELLVRSIPAEDLTTSRDGTWSAQANVGHLLDLEPLWYGRLEDLLAGAEELRPADLTNRKTHEADHDGRPVDELLAGFRAERDRLVERAESLGSEERGATALHPRLNQPMSMADLFFFVAEHDDQHLARIRELGKLYGETTA
jgi:uncharacterized damage-inducible protein DinB